MTIRPRRIETTRQQRGLRSYSWGTAQTVETLVLLLLCWCCLALGFRHVQALWHGLLAWAWPRMGIGPETAVVLEPVYFLSRRWDVVGMQVMASAPTAAQAWVTLAVLALLFVASMLVPRRHLPFIYLWRVAAFLGMASAMAFLWFPTLFRVDVSDYFNSLMQISGIVLWVMPPLHAALLYIFPLGMLQKLLATLVAVAFVVISAPFHVGALAWFVHETNTLALLPIYMLATFLPPVLAQIGIYSYFVSKASVSERRSAARAVSRTARA
ncbi:hypothetical protein [Pulveribacter sp.]|uniref:hypothetical protein n=1 Tax=Pulveribacter sp. TaxID=2678893 RepID=UPI0028AE0E50|nr:hypothetical protein [Pulveribacter sp.]